MVMDRRKLLQKDQIFRPILWMKNRVYFLEKIVR